ncbi:hypothetical protein ASD45_18155 [Pseudolabrys sp. Root1462]|uniref:SRPBCC family protein n=1 Tax=Pseudolabrys sp. Root1462 TaxID=1736466 RepID=UPI000703746C|nr:SRPBCC family protein [Pseudolabrys sp. Root1462]KQY97919.1 hypothetical protein ASD45_18155 [Pseudolabrys sp. Root1462]
MPAKTSLDLGDPVSIKGTREFDAPVDLVFTAFTDVKHLSQWWGPNGFTTTTSHFEFKPGGVWRFVMHGPDGRDYENRITFDEIVPNRRIAYHHGGGNGEPIKFSQTVTFEDLGQGRTRIVWHGVFPNAEARDFVIREHGAAEGLQETTARLAGYVTTMMRS